MLIRYGHEHRDDNIALNALYGAPIWAAWKNQAGRKVPIVTPTGAPAKVNRPSDWTARSGPESFVMRNGLSGAYGGLAMRLGSVPGLSGTILCGVDLDSCRDPETGTVTDWAKAVMARLNSYTEVSPSRTGTKVYFLCKPDVISRFGERARTFRQDKAQKHGPAIEFYVDGRYFAYTGQACFPDGRLIDLEALEMLGDEPALRFVPASDLDHILGVDGPGLAGNCAATSLVDDGADAEFSLACHNRKRFRDFKELESAVMAVPAANPYNEWLEMLFAIHHETGGSEEGRCLAHLWSDGSDYYDAEELDAKWASFVSNEQRRNKTGAHILWRARAQGWQSPYLAAGGDIDNARAFALRYAGKFLFVFGMGWHMWTGSRWAKCSMGEEREAAKHLASELLKDAMAEVRQGDGRSDKQYRDAEGLFRSNKRIDAMLVGAQSEEGIAAHPSEFDCDPWLFAVKNGVLDLRTSSLILPDPAQRIIRQAGVVFDAAATCPRFEAFLERILPDAEVRAFVQRAFGYALTGFVDEELFFFMHGIGANGKSVLATVLEKLMGAYAVTLPASALARNRLNSEQRGAIACLPGVRLALANETGAGDVWDDQFLKTITSREKLSARMLYKEPFDFMPTHKLFIRGNHLPGATDDGDGFWRRLVSIPFGVQIAAEERIPDLDRQIIADELPGVLNWALEGCAQWQKIELNVPASVAQSVAEYRQSTDLIGLWLEECCEVDPDGEISCNDAFISYRAFCGRQGVSAPSQPTLSRQLASRGITKKRRAGGRFWKGYRLNGIYCNFDDVTAA